MRTTIYIKNRYVKEFKAAAEVLDISRDKLIALLISKLTKSSVFRVKPYESVHYQESDSDNEWITMHVRFNPEIYEKAQDLRRNYKFSVSWFISFAITKYLEEIVEERCNPEKRKQMLDNYDRNFIYIAQKYGKIQGFLTLWGLPEEKYLEKLLII